MKSALGILRCALVFLAAGSLSMPATLCAQRNADYAKAVETLPPAAKSTLDRLRALRELPGAIWKMHSGDLMHGEAVDLDTGDWKTVESGYIAPNEAIWLRSTITVPESLNGYDLTGARIWFNYSASGNGPMPEILYFNGRRVALGEDLEPIVLFENARPGDKIVVAVKLLHTVDTKKLRGATLRIDIPAARPNPVDLMQEILSAAVLVPSLSPADAARRQIVLDAVAAVDLKALDAHDQARFDASIRAAQARLAALKPTLAQTTYHLDGNGHIDAAWLWPWTETVDVVKRTFGTALQLMYEYPGYTYSQSAAAYNEWMADKYPELDAEIARRVKEGRWEIVGGMWVEPDLNMPDGESLVRQLLVGNRWFKKHYGVTARIGWNPDSFGYTWQLPQILKKSGLDYFVTQKMSWNDTNKFPFKLFWWESPDGSRVLTYFPRSYVNDSLNPVRLAEDMQQARTFAPGSTELLDLYGIGDHGGGPTRATLDEGFHWSGPGGNGAGQTTPNYQFGGAQAFFTAMEKQIAPDSPTWNYRSIARGYTPPQAENGKITVPTWKAELYFEYHRGVMTTQANQKRNMRLSEIQALDAEKFASLAWLYGRPYPGDELTEDWKKILFNQFHDTAAGSGIGVIYKDAQKDYDLVRWSTDEISSGALASLAARIDTARLASKGGQSLVVFNPLAWERSGEVSIPAASYPDGLVLTDPDGGTQTLAPADVVHDPAPVYRLFVRGLPALGYKSFRIDPGSSAVALKSAESPALAREENGKFVLGGVPSAALRVEIDKTTGCMTSILDQRTRAESIAPGACGNQLQFFRDTPKDYDAWNVDPGTFDKTMEIPARADAVEILGGKAIRVTRTVNKSKFVQTLSLNEAGDLIDVDNQIDWHEAHVLVKAAFPLAATSDFATYEIPYGAIERPTTRNNSWEKAQFEVPAMRWADLGNQKQGLSLINQDKYGYDAVGNLLRLTLLRSPKWPDPDADMGHHHFRYAIYPHAGLWKQAGTVRRGWEYSYPLSAVVTSAHRGSLPATHSFLSVEPENLVLTAVKKAEDANGLILRAYEWAGKTGEASFHLPDGATSATLTNMSEIPEGAPLAVRNGLLRVPIHPYEILTLRVDYPQREAR